MGFFCTSKLFFNVNQACIAFDPGLLLFLPFGGRLACMVGKFKNSECPARFFPYFPLLLVTHLQRNIQSRIPQRGSALVPHSSGDSRAHLAFTQGHTSKISL